MTEIDGENAPARREKIKQAAARITSAAEGPVVSEGHKRLIRDVQRSVREETAGNVVFRELTLDTPHLNTGARPAESGSGSASDGKLEKQSPPTVESKSAASEIDTTPLMGSALGRSLKYFVGPLILLLLIWGALQIWQRRQEQKKEEAELGAQPDFESDSGDSSEDGRRRRKGRSSRKGSSGDGDGPTRNRRRRRRRRRGGGIAIGILLVVALGLSAPAAGAHSRLPEVDEPITLAEGRSSDASPLTALSALALNTPVRNAQNRAREVDELIAIDASGSNYEKSMADAHIWLTQAVSNGKAVRVIAFGDSSWVVAERADNLAAVDTLLEDIPEQSLTRLADALRFVGEQARMLREQGSRPQVRLSSDFDSDDSGNEAMKYLAFAQRDSAAAAASEDTTAVRDTVARDTAATARSASAGAWWWGGGLAGLVAVFLVGLWIGARRREEEPEGVALDRTALCVASGDDRSSYTWREIVRRETLPLREKEELLLAAREREEGRRTLMLGLDGTNPLEENDTGRRPSPSPERRANGEQPERRRRRRRRRPSSQRS
jgi:hypothetical protein